MVRSYFLVGLGLVPGCLAERGFECASNDQCLQAAAGVCEPDHWCSYPKTDCGSGRVYGPHAPQSVAGTCVQGSGSSSSGGTFGSSSDDSSEGESGSEPAARCGDGVVDPGELCDDGNHRPNDGCHPQCVAAGSPAWTVTYDGEAHSEDRGFGVTVDAAADAIYVVGFTTVDEPDRDILIQRRRLHDGGLVWSRAVDGGVLGEDTGEHIAVDSQGNVIVVGWITTASAGTDMWLAKYDPQGEPLWVVGHDEAGGDDVGAGVAVGSGDRIIVVGNVQAEGHSDAWMQWYDPSGAPDGAAILRGDSGANAAIDVIAQGSEFQVTGFLTAAGGGDVVWAARYDAGGGIVWEDQLANVVDGAPTGNAARGVGQDFDPLGGSAIAGVVSNDVLVQHYDAAGARGNVITIDGPAGTHDEAADVAFSQDGSFVVAGFLDFSTDGFAKGDSLVWRYAADGTLLWSDRFEGEAKEIDKALGVEIAPDLSAVVVGYETVPGQSRDLWLRRYAL